MPSPPDRQCRTGGEAGYDFYIWECLEGDHVVIGRYTSNATCGDPQMHSVPCGELTDWELEYESELGEDCEPPPESLQWPE